MHDIIEHFKLNIFYSNMATQILKMIRLYEMKDAETLVRTNCIAINLSTQLTLYETIFFFAEHEVIIASQCVMKIMFCNVPWKYTTHYSIY